MSRPITALVLMFAFIFTTSASTLLSAIDAPDSCRIMADDKKDGDKKEGEAEEEPDCE